VRAIIDTDVLHDTEDRIAFVAGDPGKIRIDDLEIASPAGATMLKEKKIEIDAGDRVLIVGESGTGKTLLFRALAGLWRVSWPARLSSAAALRPGPRPGSEAAGRARCRRSRRPPP